MELKELVTDPHELFNRETYADLRRLFNREAIDVFFAAQVARQKCLRPSA
jgi:hypothetical protein